jgi:NAD(P)-dependent dehydrogenase (short-subunit alcohol dehydrogenase family)
MSGLDGDLSGRTCIVTGAGSGIGAVTASVFAAAGARVLAVDFAFDDKLPDEEGIERVLADVTDPDAPQRLADSLDRADAIACFAGISIGGSLQTTSDDIWTKVYDVNVIGTVRWIRPFIPLMRAARCGSIITVASQLALSGGRGNPSYIASKGAVIALTRCMALDFAADNIRSNCIVPGAIDTPMLERSFGRAASPAQARSSSLARHALGRFGRPREVAEAALFLASDRSSFTTGVVLPVDGGWLA